jgi:2-phosphosulfolactate phosphatase
VRIDVVPMAERIDPRALAGAVALVIDVLRASTSMVAALSHGCAGIVPVAEPEEARQRAAELPAGTVLLAGERRGEPIPGFDLGNSPLELGDARVCGKTVVMTTSNGTRALLAVRSAAAVAVAALVNLGAAAAWAGGQQRDVLLVCAGERGALSLEDHACAGLLVERLRRDEPTAILTAAAMTAADLGRTYDKDVSRLAADSSWARHLTERGRAGDVAACLALDTSAIVPVYRTDIDKVVAGSP